MRKLVAGLVLFAMVGCQRSVPVWSWNGLSLGMPFKDAAPIVQRLCGAEKPLRPAQFPEVETSTIGCEASQAELAGQRVGITVQFYKDKIVVVTLSPPRETPQAWWQELEKSFDAKYGKSADVSKDEKHAREWKTKREWIRTNDYRSVAFADLDALTKRTEAAKKLKAAKKSDNPAE